MKKMIGKVMALGLAGAMVLGMGSMAAYAADPVTTFDVPITQTLYFKNADSSQVYEPNIYYTYEITPGVGGAKVKDHAGNAATVKAGDMRGFGLDTVSGTKTLGINFSSDHKLVTAATDGKSAVTKKVTVQFDGSKIVADEKITPGVYRYIITAKTDAAAKNKVGITEEGNPDRDLVLDVYVQNDGTIGGAVIHDPDNKKSDGSEPANVDNSNDPNGDNSNDDKDDKEGKTTGFGDPDPTPGDGDDFGPEDPKDTTEDDDTKPAGDQKDPDTQLTKVATPTTMPNFYDLYTTYDVTITKSVTGAMGDKSNFFPFKADLSNSIAGAAFTYNVTDNGSKNKENAKVQMIATAGTKTLGAAAATVADGLELRDGGKINLIGVPSITNGDVSVLANEYNNTADQYKVTATDFGIAADTALAASTASAGATAASFKDDTAKTSFTVTNNLEAVSPTGVALRFAPYIMMIGAAFFLVAFTRRRSVED